MRERIRLPDMDVPKPWRLAVLILAGVVIAALAAWWAGTDEDDGWIVHSSILAPAPVDPLVAEFRRCQGLGEAGAHDANCLAAWAENRRRFLGLDRRPLAPNPQASPLSQSATTSPGAER